MREACLLEKNMNYINSIVLLYRSHLLMALRRHFGDVERNTIYLLVAPLPDVHVAL